MRFNLVAISSLFLTCCYSDVLPVQVSVRDCYRVFNTDEQLLPVAERAADRWGRATGCVIEISGEGDVGIPITLHERVWDSHGLEVYGLTSITKCNAVNIYVSMISPDLYETVSHEIGHALAYDCRARVPLHSVTGLMKEIAGDNVIDYDSLALICSGFDCKEFNVEM